MIFSTIHDFLGNLPVPFYSQEVQDLARSLYNPCHPEAEMLKGTEFSTNCVHFAIPWLRGTLFSKSSVSFSTKMFILIDNIALCYFYCFIILRCFVYMNKNTSIMVSSNIQQSYTYGRGWSLCENFPWSLYEYVTYVFYNMKFDQGRSQWSFIVGK